MPHSRINDYAAALEDEQTRHMGWVSEITLPGGTRTRTFGSPIRFNGVGFPIREGPPRLGEHTEQIRADIALSETIGGLP